VTQFGFLNNHVRLGAQFDYRGGFVIANQFLNDQCAFGTAYASVVRGAPLAQQAACLADVNYGTNRGLISDGSFVRFRELSLTFVVPDQLTRNLRARTMTLTISARNIALWTRYTGGDPESAPQQMSYPLGGQYAVGGGLPSTQYWLARINIGL
jgi:hypothetical protein